MKNKNENLIAIKIRKDAYETLKFVKEEYGIPMSEALRIAVREKYGKEK